MDEPGNWDEQGLEVMREAVARADPALLMEVIGLFRRSLDAGLGDPTHLAGAFGHLYELTADPRALQASVAAHRLALQRDPESPRLQSNLGQALTRSFELTDDLDTIGEAVQVLRAAAGRPAGGRSSALRLSNLGAALNRLYQRTGELEVLDDAIEAHLNATRPAVSDPAVQAALEVNLANALLLAYRNTGARVRLDTAVSAYERAVAAVPPEHPYAAGCHAGLGDALLEAAQADGSEELLREATAQLRLAVEKGEESPVDLPLYLHQLGSALRVQYTMRGDVTALEEAIRLFRVVVVTGSAHSEEATSSVQVLARALRNRFEYGGELRYLEEAERRIRALLERMPGDHPHRLRCQEDLATILLRRGEHTHDAVVLVEAANLLRTSIEAAPPGHPQRFANLVNLGACLISGSAESADEELASEAVEALETALTSAGTERDRADCLINLAGALGTRFRHGADPADDVRAAQIRIELMNSQAVPPLLRGMAARDLGNQRARSGDFKAAAEAFGRAVKLLDLVVWRGLHSDDKERLLVGQFPGLATAAAGCAIRANDLERAVDLLEWGRNVLLSQAMETRIDLAGLHHREPALAERLGRLHEELESPVPAERRRELAFARDGLLREIRTRPGLSGFLVPQSPALLRSAASEGPIVMANVSEHGCDALITSVDGTQAIPLPGLSAQTATELAREFLDAVRRNDWESSKTVFAVLGRLWDTVTGPVLEALGPGPGQRIWWVPTGPLTVLPLHAAGHYPDGPCVADRVVSSYTSTIRALLAGRVFRSGLEQPDGTLIVAVPSAPGHPFLPRAEAEAETVSARTDGQVRTLKGPEATKAAVLAGLAANTRVHFACHATTDAAHPSASRLELHDGPLAVHELLRVRSAGGRLAFLSACGTAFGGHRLPDETIHVASAMQLAGYTDVIASLWDVEDTVARNVAELWYEAYCEHSPAVALHLTTSELRRRYPGNPLLWAAYLHLGPGL